MLTRILDPHKRYYSAPTFACHQCGTSKPLCSYRIQPFATSRAYLGAQTW
ncbi:hypothetical protein [Vibrio campbellii]